MKFLFAALLASAFSLMTYAQQAFPLWPEGAPGAMGSEPKDIPTLTAFIAKEKASGAAIVVLPGGGYGGHAEHEGKAYAEWLNTLGIHAFVLKYRLGSFQVQKDGKLRGIDGYKHPRMLEDAARSLRTVRARASEWNINPGKIGIMGSSAGGHLASTLLTHFDSGNQSAEDPIEKQSSRPDLGILCYPVITMGEHTHQGSRNNLLGKNPSPELIKYLSTELQVTRNTPPTFLFHTVEDTAVPVENSLMFAESLRRAGVKFDLHIYANGPHGIGLANGHQWTKALEFWLKQNTFLQE